MTGVAGDPPRGVGESFAAAPGQPVVPAHATGTPPAAEPVVEPERALAEFPLRIDEETLREVVDEPWPLERIRFELTKRLATATDGAARARYAGLRAVASRLLGRLNDALDDAETALRYAEATGSAQRIAVARTRLARVLQWRGDYQVADELYQRAIDSAIPNRLRAAIYHHFGLSCYEQGRFLEALQHFETALALHPNQPPEQAAVATRAFAAITLKARAQGFGPFPRTRAEVLGETPPPRVRYHDVFRRYGYADASGSMVVPATFEWAEPFSGGYAWVRPDGTDGWAVIDTTGETVLRATGYQAVGPFSEGLAWVLGDPVDGWFAIDHDGRVVVPPARYEDVRPFHAGVAAVCRNGLWGAVSRDGREVVPPAYAAFRTAITHANALAGTAAGDRETDPAGTGGDPPTGSPSGSPPGAEPDRREDTTAASGPGATYLSGFTSEGLAVVERDGLVGVINRAAEVVVPVAYRQIEIHPVGYLVLPPRRDPDYRDPFRRSVDFADGWGAMDRRGRLVVETVHPDRDTVLEELEKLLKDAHPLL